MRKVDDSVIEVQEDVSLHGLGVTLETGDKIKIVESSSSFRFMIRGKAFSRNYGWTDSIICGDNAPAGMVAIYSKDFPQSKISVDIDELRSVLFKLEKEA